jgi:hypothetical protein
MHQNDLDKFKLRMQRAVLERASIETLRAKGIANMDRWEAKREATYLAMLQFACGLIAWRSALSK